MPTLLKKVFLRKNNVKPRAESKQVGVARR
jgi:hypothetical protein